MTTHQHHYHCVYVLTNGVAAVDGESVLAAMVVDDVEVVVGVDEIVMVIVVVVVVEDERATKQDHVTK